MTAWPGLASIPGDTNGQRIGSCKASFAGRLGFLLVLLHQVHDVIDQLPFGAGLSQDLEKTTAELFERYVERYSLTSESSRRDDEDIWRSCWE
jgi:hypothetical protein